ncbi:MAG: acyl-CoA dehydrogenase family protein [Proteobacteria bacterium]|nr:acyl-CoA dehydrogenase family protein [Pseudomonadota bacterium]
MISFEPDDEQKMLRETLENFSTNVIRKAAHDCEEKGEVPEDLVKKGWELGLIMSNIPETCGGAGMKRSAVTGAIAVEALAWGDLSIAINILSPALVAYPILESGTEEQKQKYLRQFCSDAFKPATVALVEPRMFFDASQLTTKAVREGDEYVLNGDKCLVPLANKADLFLVFAATTQGIGLAGVDGFIIEKDTYGIEIKEKEKNMGLKALETFEVSLSDCHIPIANKLGGDEKGGTFLRFLNRSRVALAAAGTGMGRAALEYSLNYAKERVAFGEPIASRQAIAFMLAEMAIEVDATRLLAWEAAWKIDRSEDCSKEAYLAKKYAQDMVLMVADRSVQILGGHGYIREHPVEMYLRNGRGFTTFEGLLMV